MNYAGLILVAVGIFGVCGAGFDWDFFMNSRKARFFTSLFGRTVARVFYAILGSGLVVAGILMVMGIIKDTR